MFYKLKDSQSRVGQRGGGKSNLKIKKVFII